MNTTDKIDISNLDKAEVLRVLFNDSKQQGLGLLNPGGREPMSHAEASDIIKQTTNFDYLKGRVMKVSLDGDAFDPRWYDRDNGEGAAARAVARIKR